MVTAATNDLIITEHGELSYDGDDSAKWRIGRYVSNAQDPQYKGRTVIFSAVRIDGH